MTITGKEGAAQQCRQDGQPFLLAQAQIKKGQIEEMMTQRRLRFRAIACLNQSMGHRFQRQANRLAQAGIVVNKQNVHKLLSKILGLSLGRTHRTSHAVNNG